jgi:hypothetical protein
MAVKKQPAKPTAAARPAKTPAAQPARARGDVDKLIAEEAYYRAQQRGFEPGHELEDWIAAEKEVRRRMEGTA